ncbi:MAG: type II toxin-antitoxin system Phd/YefM family antitoxin [Acidobacteria bacterium]|nr:type II toxin-antitoxin system Phd/YefM family antitoxin [Acidobacteriota bacterium]
MIKVNLAVAKARLSHYLASVERGETVILCRRNVPVAEIGPLPRPLTQPRPIGTDPDLVVPDCFFDPLPDDLLGAFEGRASAGRNRVHRGARAPLSNRNGNGPAS